MDMLTKGIIIGATGVGLAWLGTIGVNKFRENKLKGDREKRMECLEKMEEDDGNRIRKRFKMDDEVVCKLANTNLDKLSELIDEINNNGKIVN